ncbi:MAG: hypothetical protein RL199_339 [Pseudomonadota bacterium]|jgi:hypothetical protein
MAFEQFRAGLEALRLALEVRDWAAAERLATEVDALTTLPVHLPPEQWRELLALHAVCMRTMSEAQSDLESQRRDLGVAQRARSAYGVDG